MSEDAVFTDETAAEEGVEADESAAQMNEPAVVEENNFDATQPPLVKREPADPLSKILNNPIMLAGVAGALLLILGVIGMIFKRRKAASTAEATTSGGLDDLESLADEIADAPDDDVVAAAADEASDAVGAEDSEAEFDSDSTMILDTPQDTAAADSGSAAAIEEDEPRDDVIAEADVYLAYGIYQQAEELLTQAIADNPERDDYRVKLAETHYASKNKEAFLEVAGELQKRTENADSPAWKKVMVMGQDMCADDAMFQGSMVGGLDVDSLAPNAPEMDFDLGLDTPEEEPATDLDLSLDAEEDALELPEETDSDEHDSTQLLDSDELETAAESEETPAEDIAAEEIDELEFDLSDTGAVETEESNEDEFSLDIDADELDIDIDMTDDAVDAKADEGEEESIDLGDVDLGLDLDADDTTTEVKAEKEDDELDVGEIDLDFGLDDTDADEEVSLDLTDDVEALDMDLGDADEETAEPEIETETPAAASTSDDDDFDLNSLDDVDEISTKLDLARAYLDMGDHEGTRGILEEVMAEGDDEQKKEAADLMEKLD